MRKWYVVLIALAFIAVAWGIGTRLFVAQKAAAPESPLASVSFAYSTNAKGKPWTIQTGKSQFTVASKETYPRFVLGTINPTKVSIGDTQKMQIVVRDNVPLVKVWAVIEHDNGTTTVPLTLGASSTVSYNTIENQKYLVGNDGKLVVNDGKNKTPAIADLIQSLVQEAQAEQAMDYSYSGSWIVHDTATITYHTTFYALDAQGRTTKLVLAWSDPCSIGTNGFLQNTCNLTSATDGTDATSTNLSSYNLTLGPNGLYVVNPNYSVIIPSGASITINCTSGVCGTLNTKEYLYYQDQDGDGYTPNNIKFALTISTVTTTWNGYNLRRVSATVGGANPTLDCYDQNANAHPGQTAWFTTNRGDGSFNYSCSNPTVNGVYNPSLSANGKCDPYAGELCPLNYTPSGQVGFTQTVACGASGNYVSYPGTCGSGPNGPNACVQQTETNNCSVTTAPAVTPEYTKIGTYSTYGGDYCSSGSPGTTGWIGSVPACGQSGTYLYSTEYCNGTYVAGQDLTETLTQACH